jgi:hypothetical protein
MSRGGQRPSSNLIVDTTFSSLFGSTPTAESTGHHTSMTTAEAREQFLRNSISKKRNGRALRPDEQDIHTIRTPDHEPMLMKSMSGESYATNNGASDARLLDLHPEMAAYRYNNTDDGMQTEQLRLADQRNIRPAVDKLRSHVSLRLLKWHLISLNFCPYHF